MNARDSELDEMVRKRIGKSERRQERLSLEEQWMTLRLFWENRSDCEIQGGRVLSAWSRTSDPDEVRYKVNLIRAHGDTAVAKVRAVNATFMARPPTDQKRHRDAAEVTNKVFKHIQQVTKWDRTHLLSTIQAMIYGTSPIEVGWDPKKGEPDRYYLDSAEQRLRMPAALLTEEQRQEKESRNLFEDLPPGDLDAWIHSPFGFHWDTASRDRGIAGCHWVGTRHYVDVERVAEAWGVDENDIPAMDADSGLLNYEEYLANLVGIFGSPLFDAGARAEEKRGKRTLKIEIWQRPDSKNPKGMHVVWCGGRIMNSGKTDNPFCADRSSQAHLPFLLQHWKPRPGNFWGVGLVEDALQPQYWTNQMRSSKMEFALVHGQPAIFMPSDSGLDTAEQTTKAGRIYRTRSGMPMPVQIGPTPQQGRDVGDVAMMAEGDLNRVMSQTEIDGGKLPGQMRSGSGMRAINEERFVGLTIPAQMSVDAICEMGNISLSIAKLRYSQTKERLYRYLNDTNEWAVQAFTGADIVNDIVVVGEVDIADSIQGQRDFVMDMVATGIFDPTVPPDLRAMIFKSLKYKTADGFIAEQVQAEDNEDREVQEMIADPLKYGEIGYPVMPWENHAVACKALVRFMYSNDFRRLSQTKEGLRSQAMITMHWQQHAMMLAQQQAQQAMMQRSLGGGEQKGQPSKPKQPQTQE